MKNAIGFCLILLFITYNSIGAISLKKVASLNTSKGFPNSIHSVSESKRQFFDNGSKVLIGQDYSLSISYKFYLADLNNLAVKPSNNPVEIKSATELVFPYSKFCETIKNDFSEYNCDAVNKNESYYLIKTSLLYLNSTDSIAAISDELYSSKGNATFLAYWNTNTNSIISVEKLPGNIQGFGLTYMHEGDLFNEKILWYFDEQGSLFRIDFKQATVTQNKTCGEKFHEIYEEHQKKLEDEKKRSGKEFFRMPMIRLTPFISADEKYVTAFDYSDIDDGDPVNATGNAYYCDLTSGSLEKLPGQHTIYGASMALPGKILYYNNQRGEYYTADLKTKKLSLVLKGRNMGDRLSIFEDSVIVFDNDFAWIEARKQNNLKQLKQFSLLSMEKITNKYNNRLAVDPPSSTLIFSVFDDQGEGKPIKMRMFIYKISAK